jgi:hypothetical protein
MMKKRLPASMVTVKSAGPVNIGKGPGRQVETRMAFFRQSSDEGFARRPYTGVFPNYGAFYLQISYYILIIAVK